MNLTGPELAKLMKIGTRIVRGTDWKWGDQDGPSGEGRIISEVGDDGCVSSFISNFFFAISIIFTFLFCFAAVGYASNGITAQRTLIEWEKRDNTISVWLIASRRL